MPRPKISTVGIVPNFSKRRCRVVFEELTAWLVRKRRKVCVSAATDGTLPAVVRRLPMEADSRLVANSSSENG